MQKPNLKKKKFIRPDIAANLENYVSLKTQNLNLDNGCFNLYQISWPIQIKKDKKKMKKT